MRNGREVILLVEGDGETRNAEKAFLEKNHYQVIAVEDGKAALDYLKDNPNGIDLVISALELPVINGIELLKLLKLSQRMRDVPVLLVIPLEREKEKNEAMDYGAEDIILSPFDYRTAANRIRNIMAANARPLCINVMEEMVARELDKCIDSLGLCRCRQCRKDVLSLSLNRLKPRYVSTEKGKLLSCLDQMSYDCVPEMLRALTESAEIVKRNPNH